MSYAEVEPADVAMSVSVTSFQKRALRDLAQKHDVSMSSIVRAMIERELASGRGAATLPTPIASSTKG